MYLTSEQVELFWSRVDKSGGPGVCWPWMHSCNPAGYGRFHSRGLTWAAHRVAYELTYRDLGDDLVVCHQCDNPPCCNPDHLFKGTHTDNMRDASAKGRMGKYAKRRALMSRQAADLDVYAVSDRSEPGQEESEPTMMSSNREYTQVKRPFAPPVDLDGGRFNVVQAAFAGGFVMLSLLIAAIGGWLASINWQVANLGLAVGVVLFVVGTAFGLIGMYVSLGEWMAHRERVAAWHEAALLAYRENGQEVVETVSEWDFSADNPAHVLITALSVAHRLQQGSANPWSVRALSGPVFLGSRRVGNVSKIQAEEMGKRFVRLGLVDGRSERQAGQWVPQSADELTDMVWKNWK